MSDLWICFWTAMIFASIAWYGFLVFYIGAKGGKEIKTMIRGFEERDARDEQDKKH
jgi:hypothetical protein